jgi:CRISPR-associated exonuclease Cas4
MTEKIASSDSELMVDATSRISSKSFREWHLEQQFAKNIREGQSYFNGPSRITPPNRHSPSSLLQCHRKKFYNQLNAPEETEDPRGIFWFGTKFEEEIILPYLRDVIVDEDTYVCNSLWIDFTVETAAGELRIKGETDPVIVDREAEPLLLFEIKTKQTISGVERPNRHHKAQAHAYMKGLTEKYDRDIDEAIVIYGSRTSLNIKSFRIGFDESFWKESVSGWAEQHTEYRLDNNLPPAAPEYNWECEFCPYQRRCGQQSDEYSDMPPNGLLPHTIYPRSKLCDYLKGTGGAKLTPTLAKRYPELENQFGSFDWICHVCASTHPVGEIERYTQKQSRPHCPSCIERGVPVELSDPPVREQLKQLEATQ